MEKLQPWMRWAAAAAAICAIIFAFVGPRHQDAAVEADPSVASVTAPPPPPPVEPLAAASPSADPSPSIVAVYVCGAVRKAGVYRLEPGSRVNDAVAAANGLSSDADPEAINLAQPVTDGMKIDVPKRGAVQHDYQEAETGFSTSMAAVESTHAGRHHSGRSSSHKLAPGQSLDINTATEAELTQLPGVGPSLARRIVEYREANGPFQTADDLQNVSGIGPSKFAKMEPYVRL
jgi:competence protein ComEA